MCHPANVIIFVQQGVENGMSFRTLDLNVSGECTHELVLNIQVYTQEVYNVHVSWGVTSVSILKDNRMLCYVTMIDQIQSMTHSKTMCLNNRT